MEGCLWLVGVILFSGVMTIFLVVFLRKDIINWPPGPKKVPIIGNIHQLKVAGEAVHITLAKLAEIHGRLMTVWLGSWRPAIVVSDPELAWEVLVRKSSDFSSRNSSYMSNFMSMNRQIISTSDLGPYWYKLRNGLQSTTFCPNNIFEQTQLQEKEVRDMLISMSKEASSNSGVIYPTLHLGRNIIKIIGRFCFGPQIKDNVFFVDAINHAIEEMIRLSGHFLLVGGFAFLRFIPGLKRPFTDLAKATRLTQELMHPYISNSKSCPKNCYLHYLLSLNLGKDVITCVLSELFMLAVDSVSTTTAWALAFLIHNPPVQRKLYQEVSRETGSREVTVENVRNFHYLHAVVKETMRMKPIAPLAIPHRAVRNSTIAGTKIVAGTPVFVNLHKLLHDSKILVDPDRFIPDRFLDSSEEMERAFFPFGAGRRICAGMELAKLQVALTLASLVKRYKWSSVVENQLPDLNEELRNVLIMMKTPLAVRITPRTSGERRNHSW